LDLSKMGERFYAGSDGPTRHALCRVVAFGLFVAVFNIGVTGWAYGHGPLRGDNPINETRRMIRAEDRLVVEASINDWARIFSGDGMLRDWFPGAPWINLIMPILPLRNESAVSGVV
jgi:hypothetical protein